MLFDTSNALNFPLLSLIVFLPLAGAALVAILPKRHPGLLYATGIFTSGLVLVNDSPDPTLDMFVRNVGFEVGGHVNLNLMRTWRVTFAMGEGRVYVKP